ncbi:50S ribosomal protein L15 [Raphidocelis subcapitata]|uniref:50S ribosomal protein L15 n=1 Tax=Raphidocelis subcapitata TaxID=307507 RepID=A0A2V0NPF3_9CHLO|nr:50S ribosomal protein L15 [Raphidocelis subcapitata]|eukprot:GBF89474.1 50S ribosomal protein L15 [Raphidocelis subcapitata]
MQQGALARLLRLARPAATAAAAECCGTPAGAAAAAAAAQGAPASTSGRGCGGGGGAGVLQQLGWGWRGASSSASSSSSGSGGGVPFAARGLSQLAGGVRLNLLREAPGGTRDSKRVGRGNASGRGNYCGRGMKGQKARKGNKPGILFDGGQKELKKLPKAGATPSNPVVHVRLNLGTVADFVKGGRIDASQAITMQDLRNSGAIPKRVLWGVKLLARGADRVDQPLHLQVSAVSASARAAVEAAGGSVTRVYYNGLGLRALLKPEAFEKKGRRLPSAPRAWPPRDEGRFDEIGALPPRREVGAAAPLLPPAPAAAPAGAVTAAAV